MANIKSTKAPALETADFKQADGFCNIGLRLPNGKTVQIGGIPLHASKKLHAVLLENSMNLEQFAENVVIQSIHVVGAEEQQEDIALF